MRVKTYHAVRHSFRFLQHDNPLTFSKTQHILPRGNHTPTASWEIKSADIPPRTTSATSATRLFVRKKSVRYLPHISSAHLLTPSPYPISLSLRVGSLGLRSSRQKVCLLRERVPSKQHKRGRNRPPKNPTESFPKPPISPGSQTPPTSPIAKKLSVPPKPVYPPATKPRHAQSPPVTYALDTLNLILNALEIRCHRNASHNLAQDIAKRTSLPLFPASLPQPIDHSLRVKTYHAVRHPFRFLQHDNPLFLQNSTQTPKG